MSNSPLHKIKHGLSRVTMPVTGGLLILTLLLSLAFSFVKPQTAQAWDGKLPECTNVGLTYWDWLGGDTNVNGGNPNEGVWDRDGNETFNTNNGNYVLARTTAQPGGPQIVLYRPATGQRMEFQRYTDLGGPHYRLDQADGGFFSTNTITDGPKDLYPTENYTLTVGPTGSTTSPVTGLACVYTARGVTYTGGWDQDFYSSFEAGRGNISDTCDALNFGCWMGKIFDNVADTMKDIAMAVVRAITWLFMPASDTLSDQFDISAGFFQAKLGFLIYPVDFVGDLVSAMANPGSFSCTDTVCTKNFGNYYGAPFTVDFLVVKNTISADLWTWMLYAIRGLTVLGLMIMFRQKLVRILHG